MTRPLITLLTDFGTADGYAAEVKGVLLAHAPAVTIVDASHDVPPHDVETARLALAHYWRRFPRGTVHLVVVDPGVGTGRAALAIASDGRFLVGPDNGVLSPGLLVPGARTVRLVVPPSASPTFHGRDLFAPIAAALAVGASLDGMGEPYDAPIVRRTPEPMRQPDGTIRGEVITVDRFGNAITNCLGLRGGTIEVVGLTLHLGRTYGEAAPHEPIALCGSSGLIEIAVRDGNAARELELARGTVVRYHPQR